MKKTQKTSKTYISLILFNINNFYVFNHILCVLNPRFLRAIEWYHIVNKFLILNFGHMVKGRQKI